MIEPQEETVANAGSTIWAQCMAKYLTCPVGILLFSVMVLEPDAIKHMAALKSSFLINFYFIQLTISSKEGWENNEESRSMNLIVAIKEEMVDMFS